MIGRYNINSKFIYIPEAIKGIVVVNLFIGGAPCCAPPDLTIINLINPTLAPPQ
jgi:hypothetical protein